MDKKLSIIISILNSHEIVRRYILHLKKLGMPDCVETIFMDDGSDPPLCFPENGLKNFTICPTNDFRMWTQALARNAGAKMAKGEYIFFTDIDHIISKEVLDYCLNFTYDRALFPRFFAVLDEEGNLTQDLNVLRSYGLSERYIKRGLAGGSHGNTFIIKRKLWEAMGGYAKTRANLQVHTLGDDREFNRRYRRGAEQGLWGVHHTGPGLYVFPMGKFTNDDEQNPFGLFHNMYRQPWGWKPEDGYGTSKS